MVDHLQSRVTPWRQYPNHVKVRGTLSKMDVRLIIKMPQGGHSIVKNTGGGWLDSLGSVILAGKRYFGVLQKY